jgi:hypothetical protein
MLCEGRVLTTHRLGDLTPPAAVASSAGSLAVLRLAPRAVPTAASAVSMR